MGLASAMPAVCSAIGGSKFTDLAKVDMSGRSGPKNGSTVTFTFAFFEAFSGLGPEDRAKQQPPRPILPRRDAAPSPGTSYDLSSALVLLSCVKSKRVTPSPARDLYTSPLFTKARAVIEANGAEWRILSALHGLVHPRDVIEPYEETLNRKGVAARMVWAEEVLAQLLPLAENYGRVVFFAGANYREFLQDPLRRQGICVDVPMRGLSLGRQLAWLSQS
jgi:hypothetical protein